MTRNYRKEYDEYHGTPEQIQNRASRNAARAGAVKKNGKAKMKGKEVDHKDGNPKNNNKAKASCSLLKSVIILFNRSCSLP